MSSGKHWCGLVLELDPDNVDALCDRADLYISQQMYEEAIKDFQKAKDVENHPQKVCRISMYMYNFTGPYMKGYTVLMM